MVGTSTSSSSTAATQEFLDNHQYSIKSILKYERIFGHNWVSTGGEKTTKEFCERLNLKPGQTVLDVGCGTGGSAFYMAEKYGVTVRAVDLASHMISIANDRLARTGKSVQERVTFAIEDITKSSYPDNSFDVIYSRDTILHIPNKEELFQMFKNFLKPGGLLFITDYCRGDQEHSAQFLTYVKNRGYDLRTVKNYGRVLEACGFRNVEAHDLTGRFREILAEELANFEPTKDTFIKEFSEDDFNDIVDGWRAKQVRCKAGDQAWGMFFAFK